jgi:hypothetical protein
VILMKILAIQSKRVDEMASNIGSSMRQESATKVESQVLQDNNWAYYVIWG